MQASTGRGMSFFFFLFYYQDAERMEKKSRRQTELETVGNNVKLLTEMLEHFYPDSTSAADKDLMKVTSCLPN